MCLVFYTNFKCELIFHSETTISETGKDKFGKLPLKKLKRCLNRK